MRNEDLSTLLGCYSPDAVLVAPEGTFKGQEEIAAYFTAWFDAFGDFAFDSVSKLETETRALDEWVWHGTHDGPLPMPSGEELAPTGTRVSLRGADICTVEGGVIVEHHIYYDQAALLEQIAG